MHLYIQAFNEDVLKNTIKTINTWSNGKVWRKLLKWLCYGWSNKMENMVSNCSYKLKCSNYLKSIHDSRIFHDISFYTSNILHSFQFGKPIFKPSNWLHGCFNRLPSLKFENKLKQAIDYMGKQSIDIIQSSKFLTY